MSTLQARSGLPKIARVIARLNIGGPAIHVVLLTNGLSDRYDTTLLYGQEKADEGNMLHYAQKHGVAPEFVDGLGREIDPVRDLACLWRLYRRFRKDRPLIVHTHTAKAGAVGRLAAWLARVPVVVHTFHGHVFHGYFSERKTRLFLAIERFLARRTDRIFVLSPLQRDEIAGLGVAPAEKMAIVPLGIDTERFAPEHHAEYREKKRREWNIPEEAIAVGIVGRLVPVKNHAFFIDMAAELVRRFESGERRRCCFVVVGDGELRETLEAEVARRGLEPHVRFVGWQKAVDEVYPALDVVALTSINEGTPLSLIEAMLSARPVVSTAVGGVADMIDDGSTGYVVEPGDREALVDRVERLANDDALRRRVGEQAREQALQRYSAEQLVATVARQYQELLEVKGIDLQ